MLNQCVWKNISAVVGKWRISVFFFVGQETEVSNDSFYFFLWRRVLPSGRSLAPNTTGSAHRTLCQTCGRSSTASPRTSQSWRSSWGSWGRRPRTGITISGPSRTSALARLKRNYRSLVFLKSETFLWLLLLCVKSYFHQQSAATHKHQFCQFPPQTDRRSQPYMINSRYNINHHVFQWFWWKF